MKKIILAETHSVVRNGLKKLLESTNCYLIVLAVENGEQVLDAFDSHLEIDLVIAAIEMKGMDGITLLNILREKQINTPVLMISTFDDERNFNQAIGSGAAGFLTSSVEAPELFFAINSILSGQRYVCAKLSMKLIDTLLDAAKVLRKHTTNLSDREIEILQLISLGLTNAEMAERLFISKRTVEGHRRSLIVKTGAINTAVLMRMAYADRIIQ